MWKRLSRLQQRIALTLLVLCTLCGLYVFPNLFHKDYPPSPEDRAALNRIHRIEDKQLDPFKAQLQADEEFKTKAKEHLENIRVRTCIHPLQGLPFAGRASNWQLNKWGYYKTMYSPIARSVVFRRRHRTIVELLGVIFIHIAARSRLSPQMVEPCKKWISVYRLL